MRIGDRMKYEIFKTNLGFIKENIDTTQNKIASGKRILTPSDDPVASSKAVQFDSEKLQNEQYTRSLKSLQTLGSFYDSAINQVHDLLTRAKEIAVTQSSDTMNADTRKAVSVEIKGIIEQLVAVANTKVGNTYIFAGKKVSTVPFTIDEDYNVTFQGTDDVPYVYVDRGTKMEASISGGDVFTGDIDVFKVLKDFAYALETNDVDSIRDALDNIETSLGKAEESLAKAGTFSSRINALIDDKDIRSVNIEGVLSDLVDVDITQAVTEFNSLSTAYQAMLYSMAKIQEMNVLNYLK
ncbi:MAG: flagellar hook-associated protein FlgL [Syntrophorhabdaceae bacterium]|nr:flagellar hook-associated protein FlgL [Syntrophorhabdaceae bacterium]